MESRKNDKRQLNKIVVVYHLIHIAGDFLSITNSIFLKSAKSYLSPPKFLAITVEFIREENRIKTYVSKFVRFKYEIKESNTRLKKNDRKLLSVVSK